MTLASVRSLKCPSRNAPICGKCDVITVRDGLDLKGLDGKPKFAASRRRPSIRIAADKLSQGHPIILLPAEEQYLPTQSYNHAAGSVPLACHIGSRATFVHHRLSGSASRMLVLRRARLR